MYILKKLAARKRAKAHVAEVRKYIGEHIQDQICYSLYDTSHQDIKAAEKPDYSGVQFSISLDDSFFEHYHEWEKTQKETESFSTIVLKRIDEQGMTAKDFYSKAGLDRKLFSKLKTDYGYQPNRNTAICCCLALRLNQAETDSLLKCAGYALANTSSFDLAIQYCIAHRIYDLMEVNAILYELEERLL